MYFSEYKKNKKCIINYQIYIKKNKPPAGLEPATLRLP